MLKRLVLGLIFLCLVLHGANRLGALSYLYQHRFEITYTLGLIDEVPIAQCSHDYAFNKSLLVHDHHEADSTRPPVFFSTQEIHLFCSRFSEVEINPVWSLIKSDKRSAFVDNEYPSPVFPIFHPPA